MGVDSPGRDGHLPYIILGVVPLRARPGYELRVDALVIHYSDLCLSLVIDRSSASVLQSSEVINRARHGMIGGRVGWPDLKELVPHHPS